MKDKQRETILILGVCGLIFVLFILITLRVVTGSFFKTPKTPAAGVSETGFDTSLSESEQKKLDDSYKVQSLVDKTPHQGNNFSFDYSFDTNEFILYINPQNQAAGNAEFDAFLNENGVESRSWITNLTITTAKPTQ